MVIRKRRFFTYILARLWPILSASRSPRTLTFAWLVNLEPWLLIRQDIKDIIRMKECIHPSAFGIVSPAATCLS